MSDQLFEKLGPEDKGNVAAGFVLGLGPGLIMNFFSGCASVDRFNDRPAFMATMFACIALGQLLFTLPFYLHFKKQGKSNTSLGLIIGASISCLIGVACGASLGP